MINCLEFKVHKRSITQQDVCFCLCVPSGVFLFTAPNKHLPVCSSCLFALGLFIFQNGCGWHFPNVSGCCPDAEGSSSLQHVQELPSMFEFCLLLRPQTGGAPSLWPQLCPSASGSNWTLLLRLCCSPIKSKFSTYTRTLTHAQTSVIVSSDLSHIHYAGGSKVVSDLCCVWSLLIFAKLQLTCLWTLRGLKPCWYLHVRNDGVLMSFVSFNCAGCVCT